MKLDLEQLILIQQALGLREMTLIQLLDSHKGKKVLTHLKNIQRTKNLRAKICREIEAEKRKLAGR